MLQNSNTSLEDLIEDLKQKVKEGNDEAVVKGIKLAFQGFKRSNTHNGNTHKNTDELLRKDAIKYLGISQSGLYGWIKRGYISKGLFRGGKNYYSISELEQAKKNAERK